MSALHRLSRIFIWVACLLLSIGFTAVYIRGQTNGALVSDSDPAFQEKQKLLAELLVLEARASQLSEPLARAAAEVEIADGIWALDQKLAEKILRHAYDLTFPPEEEQSRLRNRPVGSPPILYGSKGNARLAVRRRVLEIARRNKEFASELVESAIEKLGVYEGHVTYASLADDALKNSDIEAGRRYILQAINADPTQSPASTEISRLAAIDRRAADDLILQYIDTLNTVPLSVHDGSKARVFFLLAALVPFPNASVHFMGTNISPPGPAVQRAYAVYMLNTISQMDSVGVNASRGYLLALWPIISEYAPELKQQFLDLEQRSRKPGENFSLPTTKSLAEESKAKYDKGVDKEIDSDHPDETVIRLAIGRQDFSKARKMIDKLADGPQKIELLDMLNTGQAISLANKGDIPGARKLAESLVKAASILRVFPVIAAKCAATNDNVCARDTINQAVKQLKKADVTPFAPPPGVPASIMGTSKDFDPVLSSLGGLASAVISVKDELALDVLDELVIAANNSELDTGLGRTGFETSLFKKLADKNEARVNLAAMQLKDPLRQIIALAAIDQWKSDKLTAEAKLRNVKNESTSKKN